MNPAVASSTPRLRWKGCSGLEASARAVAEETPIALVHDASTSAVMMASPADLEDFAVGFSLAEGLVETLDDIREVEVVAQPAGPRAQGLEVRIWLKAGKAAPLAARRRLMAGPTGCGLCGVESLEDAIRPLKAAPAGGRIVDADELIGALRALELHQPLGAATHAAHAAALWTGGRIAAVREDVGRHNALDKLIGAVARGGLATREGVLLLTSRVSVEMVQKASVLGAPILCAISAPTALAIRLAQDAGLTLVGVARADGLEVFAGAERIRFPS